MSRAVPPLTGLHGALRCRCPDRERKGDQLMSAAKNVFVRLSEQRGQTMAEYAVVLAVITVVIIASLQALSSGIGAALDSVTGILPGVGHTGQGASPARRPLTRLRAGPECAAAAATLS